ncbi:hypothetical protein QWY31_00560 [Cytophagales bacterium LB-30]|uniref:Cyclic nucleotide-binding domain-containing protein n=1 Tax=Shiella aurantiaca TaxID=3058365 RepID=A0ABT8F0L2_9BACT|nr:hypothetical protein [Shiella aurantiaca]MDN4163967.1 hypothetical protein [Shiella aurantiaca]
MNLLLTIIVIYAMFFAGIHLLFYTIRILEKTTFKHYDLEYKSLESVADSLLLDKIELLDRFDDLKKAYNSQKSIGYVFYCVNPKEPYNKLYLLLHGSGVFTLDSPQQATIFPFDKTPQEHLEHFKIPNPIELVFPFKGGVEKQTKGLQVEQVFLRPNYEFCPLRKPMYRKT